MRLVLLVVLFACSCAGQVREVNSTTPPSWSLALLPQNVRVDPLLAPWTQAASLASAFWNTQVGRPVFTFAGYGRPASLGVQTVYIQLDIRIRHPKARIHVDRSGRIVYCEIFVPTLYMPRSLSVLTHELGHCLGLTHYQDCPNVMHPRLDKVRLDVILHRDIRRLREIYAY